MESKLTAPVSPGRIVKTCLQKTSGKARPCGRLARVYSGERRMMLCDRCYDPAVDLSVEPIEQDGRPFVPSPGKRADRLQDTINDVTRAVSEKRLRFGAVKS